MSLDPTMKANSVTDISVRVRYAETDQMGIVYHANYLVWFEIGRTELLRQRGFAYKELEEQEGCFIVVTRASCAFHQVAHYDDVLTIRTRIKRLQSRTVDFSYDVLSTDGRLLASGETSHVVTDRSGRARRFPDRYLQALRETGSA
jgi:acyl-CoA thioester hydrolase